MVDQVEKGLLTPLNIIEDDEDRCCRLEQLAESPGDLFPGRRDVLAQERTDGFCGLRLDRDVGELLDDLDYRPVRDPFAVREATAADRAHTDAADQLG